MNSWLKLVRHPNLFMVFLTMFLTKFALIDSFLEPTYLSNSDFVILSLSILFITAGGYIINDIFDVETDKINKPNKIIIGKKITEKQAWIAYLSISFLGLLLGIYLSFIKLLPYSSFYFLFTVILLFVYSKKLKKLSLIGNLTVAFLCAFAIYVLYDFDCRIDFDLFMKTVTPEKVHNLTFGKAFLNSYLLFAFITTLIREIIKDIEDIKGDYQQSMNTLPIAIGRHRANRVALGFTLLLIVLLVIFIREFAVYYPYLLAYSIVFLLLPLFFLSYKLYDAKNQKDYRFLSIFIKLIMFFGILSMLFFKLN